MKDIVKYVMGEAAKSNVSKRQVGCVIVGHNPHENDEQIVALGHNIEGQHAEAMACENFVAEVIERGQHQEFKVYVSHQPCPECAKLLADHGFTNVEVVDAFQKFDGDKLRYDLIDGDFLLNASSLGKNLLATSVYSIRKQLWYYQTDPNPEAGKVNSLFTAIRECYALYADFRAFEDALARVLTFGARKYKANNWKKCEDTGRYLAAAHRHLIAKMNGEECDTETGFDHMDHVITNLMFLYVLGYSNE